MALNCRGGERVSRQLLGVKQPRPWLDRAAVIDVVDGARSAASKCHRVIVAFESHQGAVHMQVATIGLDIAKNVFQIPWGGG